MNSRENQLLQLQSKMRSLLLEANKIALDMQKEVESLEKYRNELSKKLQVEKDEEKIEELYNELRELNDNIKKRYSNSGEYAGNDDNLINFLVDHFNSEPDASDIDKSYVIKTMNFFKTYTKSNSKMDEFFNTWKKYCEQASEEAEESSRETVTPSPSTLSVKSSSESSTIAKPENSFLPAVKVEITPTQQVATSDPILSEALAGARRGREASRQAKIRNASPTESSAPTPAEKETPPPGHQDIDDALDMLKTLDDSPASRLPVYSTTFAPAISSEDTRRPAQSQTQEEPAQAAEVAPTPSRVRGALIGFGIAVVGLAVAAAVITTLVYTGVVTVPVLLAVAAPVIAAVGVKAAIGIAAGTVASFLGLSMITGAAASKSRKMTTFNQSTNTNQNTNTDNARPATPANNATQALPAAGTADIYASLRRNSPKPGRSSSPELQLSSSPNLSVRNNQSESSSLPQASITPAPVVQPQAPIAPAAPWVQPQAPGVQPQAPIASAAGSHRRR